MDVGFGELLMIFIIVLVVFGAGRIPKIARDLGSGIREFKKAMSESDMDNPIVKEVVSRKIPNAKKIKRVS
ncbi:MAG TPA: twin-arginine translocase TatA/TatE family subunit [Spirochaetota bacterium]